jgi:hypothetical protein
MPGDAKGEGLEPPTIDELFPFDPVAVDVPVGDDVAGAPPPTVIVNVAPTLTVCDAPVL